MTFHYEGDLIGGSLQVRESRIIAELILNQADKNTWDQAIRADNRLQKRTESTAKRVAGTLRKRLERLDSVFLKALVYGDDELATQVAYVSALQRNLLFMEYVDSVVKDAYLCQAKALDSYSWSNFLEESAQRDPAIYDWTERSKKEMGRSVFRMLKEAGYVTSTRTLTLQRVIVRSEIRAMLEDHYMTQIQQCLDVSKRP